MVAVGTARFDFPGLLSQGDVDRGEYPYTALSPYGRDLTSQAHLGNELIWEIAGGAHEAIGLFTQRLGVFRCQEFPEHLEQGIALLAHTLKEHS